MRGARTRSGNHSGQSESVTASQYGWTGNSGRGPGRQCSSWSAVGKAAHAAAGPPPGGRWNRATLRSDQLSNRRSLFPTHPSRQQAPRWRTGSAKPCSAGCRAPWHPRWCRAAAQRLLWPSWPGGRSGRSSSAARSWAAAAGRQQTPRRPARRSQRTRTSCRASSVASWHPTGVIVWGWPP